MYSSSLALLFIMDSSCFHASVYSLFNLAIFELFDIEEKKRICVNLNWFTNYIYFLTPSDRSSLAKFWIYLWLFIDFQFTKYAYSFFTFFILTVSISLAANQRSQKSIKKIRLCISRLLPTTNIEYSVAKRKIIKYSDLHRWFGYYLFNILVAAI